MNTGSPLLNKHNNKFRLPGHIRNCYGNACVLGLNLGGFPFKPHPESDCEHYSKLLTRCAVSVLISLNKRGEAADACRVGISEQHEVNLSLHEGSL